MSDDRRMVEHSLRQTIYRRDEEIEQLCALLRVPIEAYDKRWSYDASLGDDHPAQITVTLGWIRKVRRAVQK